MEVSRKGPNMKSCVTEGTKHENHHFYKCTKGLLVWRFLRNQIVRRLQFSIFPKARRPQQETFCFNVPAGVN